MANSVDDIARTDPGGSPRDRVVLFLLLLSSDACASVLERGLPPGRAGFELCRLWFDEIYTPSRRYMSGLKGDYSEERAAGFTDLFSDDEFASLERFHAFLDLRLEMASARGADGRSLADDDMWQNIRRDARYLAEDLQPDAGRRQRLVEWLVEALSSGRESPLFANGRLALPASLTSRTAP